MYVFIFMRRERHTLTFKMSICTSINQPFKIKRLEEETKALRQLHCSDFLVGDPEEEEEED